MQLEPSGSITLSDKPPSCTAPYAISPVSLNLRAHHRPRPASVGASNCRTLLRHRQRDVHHSVAAGTICTKSHPLIAVPSQRPATSASSGVRDELAEDVSPCGATAHAWAASMQNARKDQRSWGRTITEVCHALSGGTGGIAARRSIHVSAPIGRRNLDDCVSSIIREKKSAKYGLDCAGSPVGEVGLLTGFCR